MERERIEHALVELRKELDATCKVLFGDVLKPQEIMDKELLELLLEHKLAHLLYMIGRINIFLDEGRREKAMRWIGFLQGAVWWGEFISIEKLKKMNAPGTYVIQGDLFEKAA